MKQYLIISIKFFAAASAIYGIGFLFLIASPPDEESNIVENANADIFSFSGIDEKQNFMRAMKSMGIRPRPYDFNGNIVYFGNGRLEQSMSIDDAANEIQNVLVDAGVNTENYMGYKTPNKMADYSGEQQKKLRKAMFNGELVPIFKSASSVQMTGSQGIGSIEKLRERFSGENKPRTKTPVEDAIHGYRYIELNQPEGSKTAEIIAVWTDDKFDVQKMANAENVSQSGPDPKVPSCIGCKRVRRVQALDTNEPYNLNKWASNSTVSETHDFYLNAMKNRGWKPTKRQQMIDKLAAQIPSLDAIGGKGISFEKGQEVVNITIIPKGDRGGSEVFSLEKYSDSQPLLDKLPVQPKPISIVDSLLD